MYIRQHYYMHYMEEAYDAREQWDRNAVQQRKIARAMHLRQLASGKRKKLSSAEREAAFNAAIKR